jgi:hypothetical protein
MAAGVPVEVVMPPKGEQPAVQTLVPAAFVAKTDLPI